MINDMNFIYIILWILLVRCPKKRDNGFPQLWIVSFVICVEFYKNIFYFPENYKSHIVRLFNRLFGLIKEKMQLTAADEIASALMIVSQQCDEASKKGKTCRSQERNTSARSTKITSVIIVIFPIIVKRNIMIKKNEKKCDASNKRENAAAGFYAFVVRNDISIYIYI